mmetsp:Transcript_7941/g.24377  ORF Transcript_7941/g.24377 Transcript_7941/m.24377 type:complete len:266 (-) Transcript_7941:3443-4240(-)
MPPHPTYCTVQTPRYSAYPAAAYRAAALLAHDGVPDERKPRAIYTYRPDGAANLHAQYNHIPSSPHKTPFFAVFVDNQLRLTARWRRCRAAFVLKAVAGTAQEPAAARALEAQGAQGNATGLAAEDVLLALPLHEAGRIEERLDRACNQGHARTLSSLLQDGLSRWIRALGRNNVLCVKLDDVIRDAEGTYTHILEWLGQPDAKAAVKRFLAEQKINRDTTPRAAPGSVAERELNEQLARLRSEVFAGRAERLDQICAGLGGTGR